MFCAAIMPLRSLRPGDPCPCSATCPISCRPRGASARPPASAPISHRETLPPLAFFCALRAASAPTDYSFASTASARAETHSWLCLPSSLPPLPALRGSPLHSRQSPPAAKHCALRRPSSASATAHPETRTGVFPRSPGIRPCSSMTNSTPSTFHPHTDQKRSKVAGRFRHGKMDYILRRDQTVFHQREISLRWPTRSTNTSRRSCWILERS